MFESERGAKINGFADDEANFADVAETAMINLFECRARKIKMSSL